MEAQSQRVLSGSPSIRARLIAVVLLAVLPVLGFAAISLFSFASGERERYSAQALEAARRLAAGIDRELLSIESGLRILGTAQSVRSGDFADFYNRAKQAKDLLGTEIILKAASGQQLVNTRVGPERPLPSALPPADVKALESNTIVVSDLFKGATATAPIISVNVPITVEGRGRLLLNAAVPTSALSELLRSNSLPQTWTAAVVDGQDVIIARSKDESRFVGQKATMDLQQNTRGAQGTWSGYTADGTPVLGAYAKLDSANWRIAVGVPLSIIEAPLVKALWWLGGLGALATILSALLAMWTGRSIASSTASLAASAAALGRSELPSQQKSGVKELDQIGAAIRNASLELARRDVLRKEAEAALRDQTERIEIVNRVGETIAADLALQSVVQKVTDAAVSLTGAEFGAFFYNVIDQNGESYTLYTISGVPREAFSKFPMPRNTHVFGPTFRGEAIVRSDDITKDERYGKNPPYNGMPSGHLPVRSYLAVPVVSRSGEVIGGLFFGHSQVARFDEKHERLLSGIASQAAVAIDNARLYEAAQKEIESRRKAEEEVRASEERFRTLANSIPPLAWMAEPNGSRVWFSDRWYEYTGSSDGEMIGFGWQKVHHPEHLNRVRDNLLRCFLEGNVWTDIFPLRAKSGEYRWFLGNAIPIRDHQGNVLRWFGTDTDITDQRNAQEALQNFNQMLERQVESRTHELMIANDRLRDEINQREATEEQLRQAQKMEAVGQLTGGVAHDFNNLLAVISGNLQMLQRRMERGEIGALHRYVEAATDGISRASTLTQRLLAFSRQQPLAPKPLDVNKLVSSMSELLRRTIGEHIHFETVLGGGVWTTYADPNQLESALLNLAVNARDAMPSGGKLTIETANSHLDDSYARANLGVSVGQYVLIAVSDTGIGMAEDVLARAFDPFFTTKPVGQGTGLGLSQVYGFVRQTGGHIKIYTEENQGTTIKIYLPRFKGTPAALERVTAIESPPLSKGETILVVEDDEALRAVAVESLNELGYKVLEASDGATALAALDREPLIDVLFTDVVMPGLNGRRLSEEAIRRNDKLKVLFTSGYTRNAIIHGGIVDDGIELLQKPYTIEQLASKLRELLDE